jgi:hypothetical protein
VNYSRLAAAATVLASLFIGCSASDKIAVTSTRTSHTDGKLFAVSAESSAFFRHGPQPGRVPDKTLPKETLVKLIRPSFGFSKVELVSSGEQGYVASEDLRPASSALVASTSAPKPDPLTTAPSTTPAVEQFKIDSNDPRLVPPPEDLPPSDLPAPAPDQ